MLRPDNYWEDRYTLDDHEIDKTKYKGSKWGQEMKDRIEEYRKFISESDLWEKLKEMRLTGYWCEKLDEALDTDQAETRR